MDARVRSRQGRDGLGGPEAKERAEAPAEGRVGGRDGVTVDLEDAVYQVHEPVFAEPGAGIEAALLLALEGKPAGIDKEASWTA